MTIWWSKTMRLLEFSRSCRLDLRERGNPAFLWRTHFAWHLLRDGRTDGRIGYSSKWMSLIIVVIAETVDKLSGQTRMHNLRKREQTLCTLFIEPTPLLLNVSFPNMVLGFWLDFKSKLKRRNILNTSSPNLALGFWLNNLWKDFQLNSIYFAPALVLLWWQMIYDNLFIIIYEKLFNLFCSCSCVVVTLALANDLWSFIYNNLWKAFQCNSIYFAPALVLLWPWPAFNIFPHWSDHPPASQPGGK